VVLAIAAAATLPWLDKAFHIDDVLYLMVAEQIRSDPMLPYGDKDRAMVLWDSEDGNPGSLFHTDYNPPLWKYLLAGAIEVLGKEEWKLHLVSTAAVVLAAWPLYLIGRRWTSRPLWCVAMILWSPFFLPGQNVMIEPFLLCLTTWATYFMIRSWEDWGGSGSALAGVFAGAAIVTKYTAGVLSGVFLVGCLLFRRPRSLFFLASASAVVGLWMVHNESVYGQQHLGDHGIAFKPGEWPVRVLTVLRIIGAVSIFWPMLLHRVWMIGVMGRWTAVVVVLASGLCGWLDVLQAQATFRGWGVETRDGLWWHYFVFTSLGAATVLALVAGSVLQLLQKPEEWALARTERFLEIWIAAILVFNVTSVPFNAVRHLLLAFVPMTWLAARAYPSERRVLPALCLVVSTTLGVGLALADYEFADAHRVLARTSLRQDVAARTATNNRVWYTGNWGWVYYASGEGAVPYFQSPENWGLGPVRKGDRVYHPQMMNWRDFNAYGKSMQERKPTPIESKLPIRSVTFPAHYYGVLSFSLPWVVPIVADRTEDGSLRYRLLPIDTVSIYDVR
jgi:4-amino-4-deoxy-L-arabinose transferase-like glycosyltransferase